MSKSTRRRIEFMQGKPADEINKLMNNEELNHFIAINVMGWVYYQSSRNTAFWLTKDGKRTGYEAMETWFNSCDEPYFSPTTDYNHLHLVLNEAKENGWEHTLRSDEIVILFTSKGGSYNEFVTEGELPLSACRALKEVYEGSKQ